MSKTPLLDKLDVEHGIAHEAKVAAQDQAHAEEQRESRLYLLRNELSEAQADLEALAPALEKAKALKATITGLERRIKEV